MNIHIYIYIHTHTHTHTHIYRSFATTASQLKICDFAGEHRALNN